MKRIWEGRGDKSRCACVLFQIERLICICTIIRAFGLFVLPEGERAAPWPPRWVCFRSPLSEGLRSAGGLASTLVGSSSISFFAPGVVFFAYVESCCLLSHHKSDVFSLLFFF